MLTNRERTLQPSSVTDHTELDVAFEDASGLSPAEYQKPAPSSLVPKTVGASQSLAVAVNTLVGVVRRNESQLLAALKPNDDQQFVEALETLKAIVGMDSIDMDSIDTLIEKCRTEIEEGNEEGFGVKVRNQPVGSGMPKPHRPERVGRPAELPRVKLVDPLPQESDNTSSKEIDTGPPVGNEIW